MLCKKMLALGSISDLFRLIDYLRRQLACYSVSDISSYARMSLQWKRTGPC